MRAVGISQILSERRSKLTTIATPTGFLREWGEKLQARNFVTGIVWIRVSQGALGAVGRLSPATNPTRRSMRTTGYPLFLSPYG
jgi:hypothetical protein